MTADPLGPPDLAPRVVGEVFDRALRDAPNSEALVTRSRRFTYAELDAEADRAANVLAELGIRPGDRVAASLPNDAAVVVAFHGAMRLGAIWLGINRVLAAPEKRYQLDDVDASILLSDDELPDMGRRIITTAEWGDAMASADPEPAGGLAQTTIDPFAPAGIAYTSGTTGRPKGVIHSQHNLLVPGAVLVETLGYGADLRKGDCLPFTILNMAVLTTLLASQAGGTSVVMDRIDADGVAEWIREERVTVWNGPPALLYSLAGLDSVVASDLATLEEAWTGGSDCPEPIRAAFEAKFGTRVINTYGLSEAPTVVTIESPGVDHVPGSSGRPLPHLRVRILDDDGAEVAAGETGEVCVDGADGDDRYRPMLGYWQRPDATAETLAGGVLRTGDVGFVDDEGRLHLRDRKSLVILRGGANVYPAEVERVIQEVDGVAASAVIGVADERLGERVVALVEPAPGATVDPAEVQRHCLEQLAKYKVPERVVVIEAMPRNAMGKIARTELADLL